MNSSPKKKILNFEQGKCKAPNKTSSDLPIHFHCVKLLAKTDMVKGSFDISSDDSLLSVKSNGHFRKAE